MAKYSPYKMKGHTLPGIKQKPDDNPGSPESPEWTPPKKKKKSSPGKWVQFIPMALSAMSSMKKNKE